MKKKLKLELELIPRSSFFENLRSLFPASEWDILRRDCYKKANYRCEICGGRGDFHPVECHEIWSYDFKESEQKLEGLIALCPSCHQVKHWGLSQMRGLEEKCLDHFCKVNQLSKKEAIPYIRQSFKDWEEKSMFDWKINIDKFKK